MHQGGVPERFHHVHGGGQAAHVVAGRLAREVDVLRAAWLVHLSAPGARAFRTIIGMPLFTMEVAIGYLGVTMFSEHAGIISEMLGWIGIDVPWLSTASGGNSARYLALDLVRIPDRARRPRQHQQRALRCGHPRRAQPLAGDVAARRAASRA